MFTFWTDDQLPSIPSPAWLIDAILPEQSVALLYGRWGTGKTFLALDFVYHIAAGLDWQGRRTKQGAVVYVLAEGVGGINARREAWQAQYGVTDLPVRWCFDPLNLRDDGQCDAFMRELPVTPALVVIDTLSQCFPGGDENTAHEMSLVIHRARGLRRRFGCASLILHHPTKKRADDARGSGSLLGNVDTAMWLHGSTTDGITLVCKKQRDAEPFADIPLAFEKRGRSIAIVGPRAQRDAFAALVKLGRATWSEWADACGGKSGWFNHERDRLLKSGQVVHLEGHYYPVVGTGDLLLTEESGQVRPTPPTIVPILGSEIPVSVTPDPHSEGSESSKTGHSEGVSL